MSTVELRDRCILYTHDPRAFKNWLFHWHSLRVAPEFVGNLEPSLVAIFHLHNLTHQNQKLALCIKHHQWVVVVTTKSNSAEGIELFKMGVKGYVQSNMPLSALEQAIATVQQGSIWISQDIMSDFIHGVQMQPMKKAQTASQQWSNNLTPREKETANAVLQGKSNKEIAKLMAISERTVKSHIRKLFDKFHVNDRLALVLKIKSLDT
ncbi:response regulator transcription factor [Marinomonas sp. 5E14-1]|uniref:response regulator transcription factor n=1 Tax=Marinomonas sp. 5E14-1 TaxID=3153922 RepID=UPI003266FB21